MSKLYNNAVFVSRIEDIPSQKHWAICETDSVNIPGDERSRTNPGHGYPASTEYHINYTAYLTEDDWRNEIKARLSSPYHKDIRAFIVQPVNIQVEPKITING